MACKEIDANYILRHSLPLNLERMSGTNLIILICQRKVTTLFITAETRFTAVNHHPNLTWYVKRVVSLDREDTTQKPFSILSAPHLILHWYLLVHHSNEVQTIYFSCCFGSKIKQNLWENAAERKQVNQSKCGFLQRSVRVWLFSKLQTCSGEGKATILCGRRKASQRKDKHPGTKAAILCELTNFLRSC